MSVRSIGAAGGGLPTTLSSLHAGFQTHVVKRLRLHGWMFLRDGLVIAASYVAAEATRFDGHIPASYLRSLAIALPFVVLVYSMLAFLFGIHRRMWQYAGFLDMRAITDATVLSSLIVALVDIGFGKHRPIPISVLIVGGVFALGGLIAVRIWPRMSHARRRTRENAMRVLIVGAGQAGQLVAADLRANPDCPQQAVGFLDDDPHKCMMRIHGVPVLGTIEDLPEIVEKHFIDTVAVAIPSASTRDLDRILGLAQTTNARIQVLPSQAEVVAGRSPSMHLRDINLDGLLDRIPSSEALQGSLVRECVEGRVVLVTGGAGSIGSELCRQLVSLKPARVLALDNNETGLFYLQQELSSQPGGELLTPILTSVTAGPKLRHVFERYHPDIVFHAAAYKHVPMLEMHSDEAVFVNVKGTLNVAQCAADYGCERFVFVSTDKAVDPINTLGFSKRIGELLVRAHQNTSRTVFCSVRFGNVIGSRGSALPEFIRQIERGGPVKVTHPDVERYFMTIPEAVSLVIQAGALAEGGELFMLDMGSPIKIGDLVKRLIRLHGLRIGKDIEIEYTGLRPGEKLTEELVFAAEQTRPTQIPGVHAVEDSIRTSLEELEWGVERLIQMATYDETPEMMEALGNLARGESATIRRLAAVG